MIGIYKITNPIGEVYIGQSKNIPQRFIMHKSKGNNNYNENTKLQKSFVLYGVDNHKFEVVERCFESELNLKENYYQNLFDSVFSGLNIKLTDKDKEYKSSGVVPKFPNVETTKLRIDRVIPKDLHNEIKRKTNQYIDSLLINHLQTQSLKKCAEEVLKQEK